MILKEVELTNKAIEQLIKNASKLGGAVSAATDNVQTDFEELIGELTNLESGLGDTNLKIGGMDGAFEKLGETVSGYTQDIKAATFGTLGLTLNLTSLLSTSFDIMQHWSGVADELREITGGMEAAGTAVGTLTTAMGQSLAAQGTLQNAMHALNNQGLKLGQQFTELTVLAGNLDQITGVAADSWANFTGKLSFDFGATTEELREMSSALLSSGLRGQQLQTVMEGVTEAIKNVAYGASNSKEMVQSLTKSISSATGVFQKMGISAQVATEFINKMLNPEEFHNNIALYARLGISAEDYFKALESGNAQVELMNKMMGNLPQLADQLASIRNPFQRFNLAKQLGLPMEMVSKLAGKTKEEIEELMKTHMEQAKGEEELKKRQEAAKASAQKWNEMLDMLKMQALAPIMGLVSRLLPKFVTILGRLSNMAANFFDAISPAIFILLDGLMDLAHWTMDIIHPLIKVLRGEKTIDEFIQILVMKIGEVLSWLATSLVPVVLKGLKVAFDFIIEIIKKNPFFSALMGVGAGVALFKKIMGERGSPMNPMHVRIAKFDRGLGSFMDFMRDPGKYMQRMVQRGAGILNRVTSGASKVAAMIPGVGSAAGAAGSAAGGAGAAASLGSVAAAAAPVVAVLAAVAGGFVAFQKTAEYFNKRELSEREQAQLEELESKKRHNKQLTDLEEMRLKELKNTQVTFSEQVSSTMAGALSLGILPLIDHFFGTDLTQTIAQAFNDVLNDLGLNEAFDQAMSVIKNAIEWLKPQFTILWHRYIKPYIIDNFTAAIENIRTIWGMVKGVFSGFMKIWDGIKQVFSGDFKAGFLKIFEGILDTLGSWYGGLIDLITSPFARLISYLETSLGGFLDWLIMEVLPEGTQLHADAQERQRVRDTNAVGRARIEAIVARQSRNEISASQAAQQLRGEFNPLYTKAVNEEIASLVKMFETQAARDKKAKDDQLKATQEGNEIAGGMAANMETLVEQNKKREAPKPISLQVLNRLAVQQFRYF